MKDSNLPEMAEESDLEDEWIEQHQKDLLVKEREKITSKFEKNNEKLVSEGQTALPEKELKEKLKAVDEMEKEMSREKKTGKIELKANATVDKLLAQITKLDERIKATKTQALDKEEGKETALGTSKLNYIDPRISAVWCKKYNVPVEKVFSKTLRDKFQWAMEIDEDWVRMVLCVLDYAHHLVADRIPLHHRNSKKSNLAWVTTLWCSMFKNFKLHTDNKQCHNPCAAQYILEKKEHSCSIVLFAISSLGIGTFFFTVKTNEIKRHIVKQ